MSLLTVTLIAIAVIFIAPFTEPYGTFMGLDGSVAVFDHNDWNGNLISNFAYTVGDFMCHQTESRSIILNGSQLPVCLRDVCILFGFAIGLGMSFLIPDRVIASPAFRYIAIIFLASVLLDWGIQYTTSFDSEFTRATTGLLAGIALAIIVERSVLKMYVNEFSKKE